MPANNNSENNSMFSMNYDPKSQVEKKSWKSSQVLFS